MTFPSFIDADVHIFFSIKRKYSLHRKVLIHNSSTLAHLLTFENAIIKPTTSEKDDSYREWLLRFEHPPKDGHHEGSGELVVAVSNAAVCLFVDVIHS